MASGDENGVMAWLNRVKVSNKKSRETITSEAAGKASAAEAIQTGSKHSRTSAASSSSSSSSSSYSALSLDGSHAAVALKKRPSSANVKQSRKAKSAGNKAGKAAAKAGAGRGKKRQLGGDEEEEEEEEDDDDDGHEEEDDDNDDASANAGAPASGTSAAATSEDNSEGESAQQPLRFGPLRGQPELRRARSGSLRKRSGEGRRRRQQQQRRRRRPLRKGQPRTRAAGMGVPWSLALWEDALAIGTGSGKVELWELSTGARHDLTLDEASTQGTPCGEVGGGVGGRVARSPRGPLFS